MVTRGLYSNLKIRQKSPNEAKQIRSTGLQKICQRQTKGFLGSRGHTWAGTIAKSNKNYQVWSHEGSTFLKKDHTLAEIPVLGNLTHMSTLIYAHCTPY